MSDEQFIKWGTIAMASLLSAALVCAITLLVTGTIWVVRYIVETMP